MRPTVWIVNESGHDYDKALEAVPNGELKPLTVGRVNPHQVDRLSDEIAQGIGRYAQPGDYLLISGTPVLNLLAGILWSMRFGDMNLLQWDAKFREYKKYKVDDGNLRRLLEKHLTPTA
jgi:hypothetical protein